MSRFANLLRCVAALAALTLTSCSGSETPPIVHWGYQADDGPALWSAMNPEWAICAEGSEQSPIDLTDAVGGSLEPVEIRTPSLLQVTVLNQEHVFAALDNGHTIQINAATGETLTVGDQSYALVQFHFHAPSEHTVDGEHYPMEMHILHSSVDGKIAVIGVFIEEGALNPAVAPIWRQIPKGHGSEATLDLPGGLANELFPADKRVYFYDGSYTTPPCSEGVKWFVMKEPIQLSREQIAEFLEVYEGNNRPVQALNDRRIHEDDDPPLTIH
jgi:carbonic anhydrase